jgi:hypothetical protein
VVAVVLVHLVILAFQEVLEVVGTGQLEMAVQRLKEASPDFRGQLCRVIAEGQAIETELRAVEVVVLQLLERLAPHNLPGSEVMVDKV